MCKFSSFLLKMARKCDLFAFKHVQFLLTRFLRHCYEWRVVERRLRCGRKSLDFLELGVGYNTPGIIRLPFEQMAQQFPHTTLVRFNLEHPELYYEGVERFVAFTEDIPTVIAALGEDEGKEK